MIPFVHVRWLLSTLRWALPPLFLAACGSKPGASDGSTSGAATMGGPGSGGSSTTGSSNSGGGATSSTGSGATLTSTATSGAGGGASADLFVPEGIVLHPPPIELPGLTMIAFTLRAGDAGLELYVALRNDAQTPACGASISVDLYDADERSLASSVIGVIGGSPYQIVGSPDQYSACVRQGDVAMAALTDWPDDVSVDGVRHLAYRCPYFEIAVDPAGELLLNDIEKESTPQGDVYRGTMTNQLAITVENPSVSIFPLAESGRPLGMLSVQESLTLPPKNSWLFESPPSGVQGDAWAIFPSASVQISGE